MWGCPHAQLAERFDPFDLSDPFPLYAQARAEEPIFFSAAIGYWVVARYDDIKAIFRDHETFSAEVTQTPYKPRPAEVQQVLDAGGFTGGSGLSGRVPPDHTRLRRFINKAFTPRRVQQMEPYIRTTAVRMIDAFARDGRADLVAQLAYDLPALAIFRHARHPRCGCAEREGLGEQPCVAQLRRSAGGRADRARPQPRKILAVLRAPGRRPLCPPQRRPPRRIGAALPGRRSVDQQARDCLALLRPAHRRPRDHHEPAGQWLEGAARPTAHSGKTSAATQAVSPPPSRSCCVSGHRSSPGGAW